MSLEGAKFICLDEAGNHGETVLAKGRKFSVGYYVSCDFVLVDERAKGVHCEIESDAFGRVTIRNLSPDKPILVNGSAVEIKRILLNNSKLSILDKEYLWLFPKSSSNEFEDLPREAASTPQKHIGIPEQPPNSCPDFKLHRELPKRFTVHNFAYCIQSDEEGNTSSDSNDESTNEDVKQTNKSENDLDTQTTENKNIESNENTNQIKDDLLETKDKSNRSVTPEPKDKTDKSTTAILETPKMNLINCTKDKENKSTQKKNKQLLTMCHQSDVVITSFSPRETGVKIEKSFATIVKPKVLVTKTPATPKSVYSTPKSDLNENDQEEEDERELMTFHTPSTSKKGGTASTVSISTASSKVLKNSSMHLIDLTTPNKLRPASPYLKSALKASAKKNITQTPGDKSAGGSKLSSEEQLGLSALPSTPALSEASNSPLETPNSVISVSSSTDTSSIIEVTSDGSNMGITPGSAIGLTTPIKSQTRTGACTPKRTPQSLMKRALLTSAKKQNTTPQRNANTATTTPRRESINRIPLRSNLALLRTPVTPQVSTGDKSNSQLPRRHSMSTPTRKSISARSRFDSPTTSASLAPASPSTSSRLASRRSSLNPIAAARALPTSTPVSGSSNNSSLRTRAACKTSPLHKVRKSVGGMPLSSHISKARRSIVLPASTSKITSIKEKSPQQVMSDRLVSRARKSLCVTPISARSRNMVTAAKTPPQPPSSILKDRTAQTARKPERKAVLFADKKAADSGDVNDLSRTFIIDSDEEENADKNKREEKPKDATFSPEKESNEKNETEKSMKKEQPTIEIPVDVEEVTDLTKNNSQSEGEDNIKTSNKETFSTAKVENEDKESIVTEESFAEIINDSQESQEENKLTKTIEIPDSPKETSQTESQESFAVAVKEIVEENKNENETNSIEISKDPIEILTQDSNEKNVVVETGFGEESVVEIIETPNSENAPDEETEKEISNTLENTEEPQLNETNELINQGSTENNGVVIEELAPQEEIVQTETSSKNTKSPDVQKVEDKIELKGDEQKSQKSEYKPIVEDITLEGSLIEKETNVSKQPLYEDITLEGSLMEDKVKNEEIKEENTEEKTKDSKVSKVLENTESSEKQKEDDGEKITKESEKISETVECLKADNVEISNVTQEPEVSIVEKIEETSEKSNTNTNEDKLTETKQVSEKILEENIKEHVDNSDVIEELQPSHIEEQPTAIVEHNIEDDLENTNKLLEEIEDVLNKSDEIKQKHLTELEEANQESDNPLTEEFESEKLTQESISITSEDNQLQEVAKELNAPTQESEEINSNDKKIQEDLHTQDQEIEKVDQEENKKEAARQEENISEEKENPVEENKESAECSERDNLLSENIVSQPDNNTSKEENIESAAQEISEIKESKIVEQNRENIEETENVVQNDENVKNIISQSDISKEKNTESVAQEKPEIEESEFVEQNEENAEELESKETENVVQNEGNTENIVSGIEAHIEDESDLNTDEKSEAKVTEIVVQNEENDENPETSTQSQEKYIKSPGNTVSETEDTEKKEENIELITEEKSTAKETDLVVQNEEKPDEEKVITIQDQETKSTEIIASETKDNSNEKNIKLITQKKSQEQDTKIVIQKEDQSHETKSENVVQNEDISQDQTTVKITDSQVTEDSEQNQDENISNEVQTIKSEDNEKPTELSAITKKFENASSLTPRRSTRRASQSAETPQAATELSFTPRRSARRASMSAESTSTFTPTKRTTRRASLSVVNETPLTPKPITKRRPSISLDDETNKPSTSKTPRAKTPRKQLEQRMVIPEEMNEVVGAVIIEEEEEPPAEKVQAEEKKCRTSTSNANSTNNSKTPLKQLEQSMVIPEVMAEVVGNVIIEKEEPVEKTEKCEEIEEVIAEDKLTKESSTEEAKEIHTEPTKAQEHNEDIKKDTTTSEVHNLASEENDVTTTAETFDSEQKPVLATVESSEEHVSTTEYDLLSAEKQDNIAENIEIDSTVKAEQKNNENEAATEEVATEEISASTTDNLDLVLKEGSMIAQDITIDISVKPAEQIVVDLMESSIKEDEVNKMLPKDDIVFVSGTTKEDKNIEEYNECKEDKEILVSNDNSPKKCADNNDSFVSDEVKTPTKPIDAVTEQKEISTPTTKKSVKIVADSPKTPLMAGMRELLKTPKTEVETPRLGGIRDLVRSPKEIVENEEEETEKLAVVADLIKTPKARSSLSLEAEISTPKAKKLVTIVADCPKTPLMAGMRELLKTPKTEVETPRLGGIRDLVRSPKEIIENEEEETEKLAVVADLVKTPTTKETIELSTPKAKKQVTIVADSPQTPLMTGMRELLKTPKCEMNTPKLVGLRNLVKTPKTKTETEQEETDKLSVVAELVKTPQSSKNPEKEDEEMPSSSLKNDNLKGIKELLKTPKSCSTPRFKGMRELMQTPKMSSTPLLSGVKELLDSPAVQEISEVVVEHVSQENADEIPSTTSKNVVSLKGVKELMKTPKSCSTPRLKGIRELMQTPKMSSTPLMGGIKELMNSPAQQKDEELVKYLRTPTAKNIMIPTMPSSAIIEKSSDSIEISTEYDLNATHEGETANLEDLFKTPVASRFVERITASYYDEEGVEHDETVEKFLSTKTETLQDTLNKSAEEAFDKLIGQESQIQTPIRKVYPRKSFALQTPQAQSPFSAADVLSDLPKTDVEEWIETLDQAEPPTILECDDAENEQVVEDEVVEQDFANVSLKVEDDEISASEQSLSENDKQDISANKSVIPETCTKVYLNENTLTNISTASLTNTNSKDPLLNTNIKVKEKETRPVTPIDAEISGINLLDQTVESVQDEPSMLDEPLVVEEPSMFEEPLMVSDNESEAADNTLNNAEDQEVTPDDTNDLSEPLMVSDSEDLNQSQEIETNDGIEDKQNVEEVSKLDINVEEKSMIDKDANVSLAEDPLETKDKETENSIIIVEEDEKSLIEINDSKVERETSKNKSEESIRKDNSTKSSDEQKSIIETESSPTEESLTIDNKMVKETEISENISTDNSEEPDISSTAEKSIIETDILGEESLQFEDSPIKESLKDNKQESSGGSQISLTAQTEESNEVRLLEINDNLEAEVDAAETLVIREQEPIASENTKEIGSVSENDKFDAKEVSIKETKVLSNESDDIFVDTSVTEIFEETSITNEERVESKEVPDAIKEKTESNHNKAPIKETSPQLKYECHDIFMDSSNIDESFADEATNEENDVENESAMVEVTTKEITKNQSKDSSLSVVAESESDVGIPTEEVIVQESNNAIVKDADIISEHIVTPNEEQSDIENVVEDRTDNQQDIQKTEISVSENVLTRTKSDETEEKQSQKSELAAEQSFVVSEAIETSTIDHESSDEIKPCDTSKAQLEIATTSDETVEQKIDENQIIQDVTVSTLEKEYEVELKQSSALESPKEKEENPENSIQDSTTDEHLPESAEIVKTIKQEEIKAQTIEVSSMVLNEPESSNLDAETDSHVTKDDKTASENNQIENELSSESIPTESSTCKEVPSCSSKENLQTETEKSKKLSKKTISEEPSITVEEEVISITEDISKVEESSLLNETTEIKEVEIGTTTSIEKEVDNVTISEEVFSTAEVSKLKEKICTNESASILLEVEETKNIESETKTSVEEKVKIDKFSDEKDISKLVEIVSSTAKETKQTEKVPTNESEDSLEVEETKNIESETTTSVEEKVEIDKISEEKDISEFVEEVPPITEESKKTEKVPKEESKELASVVFGVVETKNIEQETTTSVEEKDNSKQVKEVSLTSEGSKQTEKVTTNESEESASIVSEKEETKNIEIETIPSVEKTVEIDKISDEKDISKDVKEVSLSAEESKQKEKVVSNETAEPLEIVKSYDFEIKINDTEHHRLKEPVIENEKAATSLRKRTCSQSIEASNADLEVPATARRANRYTKTEELTSEITPQTQVESLEHKQTEQMEETEVISEVSAEESKVSTTKSSRRKRTASESSQDSTQGEEHSSSSRRDRRKVIKKPVKEKLEELKEEVSDLQEELKDEKPKRKRTTSESSQGSVIDDDNSTTTRRTRRKIQKAPVEETVVEQREETDEQATEEQQVSQTEGPKEEIENQILLTGEPEGIHNLQIPKENVAESNIEEYNVPSEDVIMKPNEDIAGLPTEMEVEVTLKKEIKEEVTKLADEKQQDQATPKEEIKLEKQKEEFQEKHEDSKAKEDEIELKESVAEMSTGDKDQVILSEKPNTSTIDISNKNIVQPQPDETIAASVNKDLSKNEIPEISKAASEEHNSQGSERSLRKATVSESNQGSVHAETQSQEKPAVEAKTSETSDLSKEKVSIDVKSKLSDIIEIPEPENTETVKDEVQKVEIITAEESKEQQVKRGRRKHTVSESSQGSVHDDDHTSRARKTRRKVQKTPVEEVVVEECIATEDITATISSTNKEEIVTIVNNLDLETKTIADEQITPRDSQIADDQKVEVETATIDEIKEQTNRRGRRKPTVSESSQGSIHEDDTSHTRRVRRKAQKAPVEEIVVEENEEQVSSQLTENAETEEQKELKEDVLAKPEIKELVAEIIEKDKEISSEKAEVVHKKDDATDSTNELPSLIVNESAQDVKQDETSASKLNREDQQEISDMMVEDHVEDEESKETGVKRIRRKRDLQETVSEQPTTSRKGRRKVQTEALPVESITSTEAEKVPETKTAEDVKASTESIAITVEEISVASKKEDHQDVEASVKHTAKRGGRRKVDVEEVPKEAAVNTEDTTHATRRGGRHKTTASEISSTEVPKVRSTSRNRKTPIDQPTTTSEQELPVVNEKELEKINELPPTEQTITTEIPKVRSTSRNRKTPVDQPMTAIQQEEQMESIREIPTIVEIPKDQPSSNQELPLVMENQKESMENTEETTKEIEKTETANIVVLDDSSEGDKHSNEDLTTSKYAQRAAESKLNEEEDKSIKKRVKRTRTVSETSQGSVAEEKPTKRRARHQMSEIEEVHEDITKPQNEHLPEQVDKAQTEKEVTEKLQKSSRRRAAATQEDHDEHHEGIPTKSRRRKARHDDNEEQHPTTEHVEELKKPAEEEPLLSEVKITEVNLEPEELVEKHTSIQEENQTETTVRKGRRKAADDEHLSEEHETLATTKRRAAAKHIEHDHDDSSTSSKRRVGRRKQVAEEHETEEEPATHTETTGKRRIVGRRKQGNEKEEDHHEEKTSEETKHHENTDTDENKQDHAELTSGKHDAEEKTKHVESGEATSKRRNISKKKHEEVDDQHIPEKHDTEDEPVHIERTDATNKRRVAGRKKHDHEPDHDQHNAANIISVDIENQKEQPQEEIKKGRGRRKKNDHPEEPEQPTTSHSPDTKHRGRKRKESHTDTHDQEPIEKDLHSDEKSLKEPETKLDIPSAHIETPQRAAPAARRGRKASTIEHITAESQEVDDTPGRRARNVPQRRAATAYHNYDETSDSEVTTKTKKKTDSPRKSLEATKISPTATIINASPSPSSTASATTARGRTRKPTAKVQQFLEEERAKAETPKKRGLLAAAAGIDNTATPQRTPARRGRKASTIDTEVDGTPQATKGRGRGKHTTAHTKEDHSVEPEIPSVVVEEKEIDLHTTPPPAHPAAKGRRGGRKAKITEEEHHKSDEPPAKKSPLELEIEKQDSSPSVDAPTPPTRIAGRRNAAAAAKARIEEDALAAAAIDPPKRARARKAPTKVSTPVAVATTDTDVHSSDVEDEKLAKNKNSPQKREHRLASATTIEGDAEDVEDHIETETTDKPANKRGRKAATATTAADSPAVPVKRSRKAKTAGEVADTETPGESKATRGRGRGRRNVHFDEHEEPEAATTSNHQNTPDIESPAVETSEPVKRGTRTRRK